MTMLDRMRRHRGWLKWIMGIVAVAMAAFFVPWQNRTGPARRTRSPTSNGTPITAGEFRRELSQRLQMFQAAGRQQPAAGNAASSSASIARCSQQLVDAARHRGRGQAPRPQVTDTEVVEFIQHLPAFRENGQFVGSDRYRAVLRAQRPPLQRRGLRGATSAPTCWRRSSRTRSRAGSPSPSSEADAEYRRRNEKVKLEVVVFTGRPVPHRPHRDRRRGAGALHQGSIDATSSASAARSAT